MPTITKSIGTTGRDYSTITAWEADLDSTSIYASGDTAVGECYNDSAFNEVFDINGGATRGLSSIRLTAAAGHRHKGVAGTGARIVRTGSGSIQFGSGATISTTVEWLSINANGQNVSVNFTGSGSYRLLKQVLFHGGASLGASALAMQSGSGSGPQDAINCIIYNHTRSTGSSGIAGISIPSGNTKRLLNCTVHKIVRTNTGDATCVSTTSSGTTVKNIVATDPTVSSGTALAFALGSSIADHNASSDTSATGTGSLTSIVTANQFVSIVAGSEDLHLRLGSALINAGTDLVTTPTGVNLDIDGFDRDAGGGLWDIGADEWHEILKSIGTSSRDYSTITAWEADLDSTSIYLSGDTAVGECYNDSAFDENVTINGGATVGLSSIRLSVASGHRHTGVAGTGARIVASTVRAMTVSSNSGQPERIVEWLEINMNNNRCGGGYFNMPGNSSHDANSIRRLRNILFHDYNGAGSDTPGGGMAVESNYDTPTLITNCIFYRMRYSFANSNKIALNIGSTTSASQLITIANCTIHNLENTGTGTSAMRGIVSTNPTTCRNVVVTDVTTTGSGSSACFDIGGGTISHNASSDASATGTGSLTSIVTADQFVSIVVGSQDLHLKSGSSLINAGVDLVTTPAGVNLDIDGFDRDAGGGVWDIGADEVSVFIYSESGLGGARVAGQSSLFCAYSLAPSGGVLCGGSGQGLLSINPGASGGVLAGSISLPFLLLNPSVSGGAILAGSASPLCRFSPTASGGVVVSGLGTNSIGKPPGALPYVCYRRISHSHEHDLDGAAGIADCRIQFDIWANTLAECKAIARAIRIRSQGYCGFLDDIHVAVSVENEIHLHEAPRHATGQWLYHIVLDLVVKHDESKPD